MTSSPNLSVAVTVTGKNTATGSNPSSGTEDFNDQWILALTGGTGGGQADTVYAVTLSIAASGSSNVDLNGALTDKFGGAVSMLHLKALVIRNQSTSPGAITVGNGTNPAQLGFGATTHTWAIQPGDVFAVTNGQGSNAGWVVTAATADILKIAAAATAGTYTVDVIAIGTST
jgi:hypothetical protein